MMNYSSGFRQRTLKLQVAARLIAHAVCLAGLLAAPGMMGAAGEPPAKPLVERMKKLTAEMVELQGKLRKAQQAEDKKEAKRLAAKLQKAQQSQQSIIAGLYRKVKEAKERNRPREVKLLMSQLSEVAKHSEYARSLRVRHGLMAPRDVIITEVCYWPKAGKAEWVELKNVSSRPVTVSGWMLLDGQTLRFAIPPKTPAVQPQARLLIKFDGTGRPPSVAGKAIVVHTPSHLKGNVLGNHGGHLALYALGAADREPGPRTLMSYVAWGLSPGTLISHALAARRWRTADSVPDGTQRGVVIGGLVLIQQGGSVGLIGDGGPHKASSWGVFAPKETTPGLPNEGKQRTPVLYLPRDGDPTRADGKATLSCVSAGRGAKYHFQVCFDRAFKRTFIDAPDKGIAYLLERPVPAGVTVYWRVRAVYPDGAKSPWSAVHKLVGKR